MSDGAAAARTPTWLLAHAANVYSQTGEDGVIAAMLRCLPVRDRWCVDVGAYDGIEMSNTRLLIETEGYSGVLIEASRAAFERLQRNCDGRPGVHAVHARAGFGPADGLDALLSRYPVPREFDFLSIDVDGNDYHVWHAMAAYRPKAICIEFNPTIPPEVPFVQRAEGRVAQGASLLALVELGRTRGYELVGVVGCNACFVDARYFPLFGIDDNSPARLWTDRSAVTYLFSGYDGSIHLAGRRMLPWHGLPLTERGLQRLPWFLRKYPGHYSRAEHRLFALLCGWPLRIRNGIRRRLAREAHGA